MVILWVVVPLIVILSVLVHLGEVVIGMNQNKVI
jgi:hypothetical protein